MSESQVNSGDLKSSKFEFSENMILYGKLRPNLNKVAIPKFKGICSTDILPILPNYDYVTKEYLAYLMRSKPFVDFAISKTKGDYPRIRPEHIENLKVIVPELRIQKEFSKITELVYCLKQNCFSNFQNSQILLENLLEKVYS